MARPCPICVSDPALLAKTNALLASGETVKAVADASGFNKYAVQRHKRHAFASVAEVESLTELEKSERRLNELASRAESQWVAACASGDQRAALTILQSQIRLQLGRHTRLVEQQEKQVEAEADDPKNPKPGSVAWFDSLVRKSREFRATELSWGKIPCPACESPSSTVYPREIKTRMAAIVAAAELPEVQNACVVTN
jgi:hypothetical protein